MVDFGIDTIRVGTIHLGDAIESLKQLKDQCIDLILTDPPYSSLEKWRNIGTTTRLKNSKSSSSKWFETVPNEYFEEFFKECHRVLKKDTHLYVMCDPETYLEIHPYIVAAGFSFKKPLIWEKIGKPKTVLCPHCGIEVTTENSPGSPGMGYPYRSVYEMVYFAEKGKRKAPANKNVRDVQHFARIKDKKAYPTEKPTSLLRVMIKQSTEEGDIVLDPFTGSGSTLVAAMQCNRRAFGFDISKAAKTHYERNNTHLMVTLSNDLF
jgi:site-specific DNA-methyltransferase (adenine-specific)